MRAGRDGDIVAEIRQLATGRDAVLAWLATLPAPVMVAMAGTLYWEWLVTQQQAATRPRSRTRIR